MEGFFSEIVNILGRIFEFFGHKIGPRPPFDMKLTPFDAEFRAGSIYEV